MTLSYQKAKNLELAKGKDFLEKISKLAKDNGLPFATYDNFLQVGPIQFFYTSHKYKNVLTKEEEIGINKFLVYLNNFASSGKNQIDLYYTKAMKDKTNKEILKKWLDMNNYYYTYDEKQGSFRIDEYTIYGGVNMFKQGTKICSGFKLIENELAYLNPSVPIEEVVMAITKVDDYNEI